MTATRRLTPAGDVVERDGDRLVITSRVPIDGLEQRRFRPQRLVVWEEPFRLLTIREQRDGRTRTWVYELERVTDDNGNLYEQDGELVRFDDDRVRTHRYAQVGPMMRVVALVVTIPLWPVLGVLPETWQRVLRRYGLVHAGTRMTSLMIESLLVAALGVGVDVLFLTAHFAASAICFVLGLALLFDTAWRRAELFEGRDRGLFEWPRVVWHALRAARTDDTPPGDDAGTA